MMVDDEVNEILGTGKNNNFSTNYNTKRQNNWQEQQRKDRQDIYDTT